MEYRKMENIDETTSLLGYGCMRFPTLDGKIDETEAAKLIDIAYQNGVTYFDTAYMYHDSASEEFTGRCLKRYPRNSFLLATKLPCWGLNTVDDAKKIFQDQLSKLQVDYIDFYLLHGIGKDIFHKIVNSGILQYCEELQAAGKIRHLGFSFHDNYEAFEDIITYRKWDFCQIQLNYMDIDEQAGLKGYHLAEKLGVPLVIMEPVKGGSLAHLPSHIEEHFRALGNNSLASYALRWVGSLQNVKVILSGMSNEEQVRDNLSTFDHFIPLNAEEEKIIVTATDLIRSSVKNGCTGCKYCMPCPAGVNIPRNFSIWNEYGMYDNKGGTIWNFTKDMPEKEQAKNCIKCGKCEEICPQKLHIRENLETLQNELSALHY